MAYESTLLLLGRIIFGGYFVVAGLNHFMNADKLSGWIESKGFPAGEALAYFSGGQLIFGGALALLALSPVIGLGAIALFLAVVTPVFHNFWDFEGEDRMDHMSDFLKNLALLGAVLVVYGARETVFASPLV